MSRRHRLPIMGRHEAEHPLEVQRRAERAARELAEAERQRRATEPETERQEELETEWQEPELGRRRRFMTVSPFQAPEHPLLLKQRQESAAREAAQEAEQAERRRREGAQEDGEPESGASE